ncbi:MAG: response regulator [bacterium]
MKNLLVIDDEESVTDLIPVIFSDTEYQVVTANSPQEGIDMLDNNTFNVALVDIKMPGKDGIEVLQQIKDKNPDIEVLIMTGHATMEQAILALKNDASDFILKPFDANEIVLPVEKAFKNYELKAKNKRLIKELSEERDRLVKMNKKLMELDQMKSSFVSTVSHELRTPLTIIHSTVNNIIDGIVGEVPPYQTKWLNMIKQNAQRLSALIEDTLNMARLESGRVDMNRERVDIAGLVKKTAENLSELAQKKNITITANIPENIPHVDANPGRIEQVLTNLITNAIKFTPEQGRIEVFVVRKGSYISVSVQDTGIGIAHENLVSIFDRFRQVQNKQDPRVKGIGLGLAIAKEIIAQHNGRIWAESGPGKGSRFIFTLPFSLFISGEKIRVMAIDDDEEIRELYKIALERIGCEVEVMDSGESAVKRIKTSEVAYDIVFCDLNLPGKNGVEVLRDIKEIDPEIQTTIVTAYPDSRLLSEALQYGPLMIVPKPIDGSKIYEVTRKLIAQKRITGDTDDHGKNK